MPQLEATVLPAQQWEALQVGELVEFGHAARALCTIDLKLITQLAQVASEQQQKPVQVGPVMGGEGREHVCLQKTLAIQQEREHGHREFCIPLRLHAHRLHEHVARAVVLR